MLRNIASPIHSARSLVLMMPATAEEDWAGQAISCKLGERAWLNGREAARRAHGSRGEAFDHKAWHMRALSLGALGLDDLEKALSGL